MFIRTIQLLPIFMFMALIAGCGAGGTTRDSNVELPDWFYNPSYPGYVGVTSSAKPQSIGGIEGQRRAALLLARAEMARMKSVQVSTDSLTSTTSSKSGVQFSNEDYRKLQSTQALQLNDVEIKDEWVHPETGELFLWLVYPVR